MDTSDPDIIFDDNGVCNHCKRAEQLLAKKWFPNDEGERKLQEIAGTIKQYGIGKEYDCIIGVSGGVDSSYLLHVAKKIMALKPLVVHVDAGWNSETAVRNIESLTNALGLDLFTYVVNWEEVKDLQLAFLRASVANQDIPQDHVFFAKLYEYAITNKIKYVLTGSNLTGESILPSSWGYDATDKKHLMAIHKLFGTIPLKTFPTMSLLEYKIYWPYILKMTRIAPLNYLDYDRIKAIKFLEDTYGWQYYGSKHHESKWTKFFQAYYLPEKFGYDKRRAHLSSLIIAGQFSRTAALEEMKKPLYDKDELEHDKEYVAKKLGITIKELENLINLPNKTYKDYPNSEDTLNIFRKIKRSWGK
jgi:N-acetyl sugar amidotransferase